MSTTTETSNARYVSVDGTAHPETMDLGDGTANTVSAIRFSDHGNQFAFVLEGRPEDVLSVLRHAVAVAEENLMQTVRSPELRRMYGDMAEASQVGMVPPLGAEVCEKAGQHVRSTRHARWVCPFVTEVDTDHAP